PEFTSRPNRPQPLFNGFIAAALAHAEQQAGDDGTSGRGRDGSSTPLDQAGSPQGFARVTQP
ncbi:MAG: hypothetical protein HYY09_02745, partial [Firmicutes bacterium]|nr:hypothetical protein [Bacillota bacterium]